MMFGETKIALKKAFEIGKILFSMGSENYNKLLKYTSKINYPTYNDLQQHLKDGKTYEEAMIYELKERYKRAAIEAGFTEKHGEKLLEYIAILEEINEE